MKHLEFKMVVEDWIVKATHEPIPALDNPERERLTIVALNEIARGGHGPTWAKTAIRLWCERDESREYPQ